MTSVLTTIWLNRSPARCCNVPTSHSLKVLSLAPDSAYCPSPLRTTLPSVCTSNVRRQRPLATSHNLNVLSAPLASAYWPSALRLTENTLPVSPTSVRRQIGRASCRERV